MLTRSEQWFAKELGKMNFKFSDDLMVAILVSVVFLSIVCLFGGG